MDSKIHFVVTLTYHAFEAVDHIKFLWQDLCDDAASAGGEWLERQEGDVWRGNWMLPVGEGTMFGFYFEVWRCEEMIDTEPRYCHYATIPSLDGVEMTCRWITNGDENNYRYTSAFTRCIYPLTKVLQHQYKSGICIMVQDFVCPEGYQLCLTGSTIEFGCWDVNKAIIMEKAGNYSFSTCLSSLTCFSEYKYILKSLQTDDVIWEEGPNRRFEKSRISSSDMQFLMEDTALRLPQYHDKLAGIVVPVFSLRSRRSWGVGDFGDLKKMVLWANKVGLNVLQVLPINDTTRTGSWEDSYPYNAISVYALHPMYADLNALGKLTDKALQRRFEARRKKLNQLPLVDYEAVNQLKSEYLYAWYDEHKKEIEIDENILGGDLKPYIYFRVLQDIYKTADFRTWPDCREYNEAKLNCLMQRKEYQKRVKFYAWVQYLLISQLEKVHHEARRNHVILKGDMPIGVSRDSATAWYNPQYFHFDGQAGAPPDFFSEKGQNWGFPTYNWENILRDGGIWWKCRLQFMSRFFDAYRIDHVLGFFRIWQIPYGTSDGRLGHFLPDLPMTEDEIFSNGFRKPLAECVEPGNDEPWNVLFIRDRWKPEFYHPAVSGQSTKQYLMLSQQDRESYDRIHYHYFYQRHNDFWANEGLRRLPCAVYSTPMLVCAEDLGMVPDCVHGVLERFRILSLEVQSMPKRNEGRFSWLPNNPYRSVDTITTHDMEPLRLWWSRHHDDATCFYPQRMGGYGDAPQELSSEMACNIIRWHMESPSLLCIVALQDWLAIDASLCNPDMASELINDPANPRHYWRYRMHLNIEDLEAAESFCSIVRQLARRR